MTLHITCLTEGGRKRFLTFFALAPTGLSPFRQTVIFVAPRLPLCMSRLNKIIFRKLTILTDTTDSRTGKLIITFYVFSQDKL